MALIYHRIIESHWKIRDEIDEASVVPHMHLAPRTCRQLYITVFHRDHASVKIRLDQGGLVPYLYLYSPAITR